MLNSEIIKNDIFRYKFIEKFLSGKIFDHQSNTFTTYHSSKILLENNVTEVYSSRNLFSAEVDFRKKDNGKIIFSSVKKEDYESYFDGVISFENLTKNNISKNLETYFKLLKKNGILVLVLENKQIKLDANNIFSINELKEKITKIFTITEIFSQRFLEKPHNTQMGIKLEKIRKVLAQILKRIDKNKQFYIKYIQKNATKFNTYKEKIKRIPDDDFIPRKYVENIEPFYFILICKRISNNE